MCFRAEDAKSLISHHVPVRFLLNYTNPVLESVSDAFAISDAHAESTLESHERFSTPTNYMHDDYLGDLFSGVFSPSQIDGHLQRSYEIPNAISLPSASFPQHRSEELVLLLEKQYNVTPDLFIFKVTQFPTDLARSVLTSGNIVEFVSAFFTTFHPHTPFLHRPSFDIDTVSSPLLLATAFLGSVFSIPKDDALSSRCFFDLTEEYVFTLLREIITHRNRLSKESIEIVQAAVLVHALQVNSNQEGVRHRIRVHRFPEIVAAMRCLGLFGSVCTPQSGLGDWQHFIEDQVKIRYELSECRHWEQISNMKRLAARVFITDCMSTLFFKSPPHVTTAEMSGNLPSTDALFEASTAAEFSRLVSSATHLQTPIRSLKDFITLFSGDDWTGCEASEFVSIGLEHLIMLMFGMLPYDFNNSICSLTNIAFHSIIFVSRTSLLIPSTHKVLSRAIARWEELWHHLYSRDVSSKSSLIGFTKYGLELWWLAQKILEVAQSGDTRSSYMTSVPTDSLKELHEFIQQHANTRSRS
jgi:hypothetical protein